MCNLNDEEVAVVEFVKGCGWGFDEGTTNYPDNKNTDGWSSLYFRRNGRYVALSMGGGGVRVFFRKTYANEIIFEGCLGDPDCLKRLGLVLRRTRFPRLLDD